MLIGQKIKEIRVGKGISRPDFCGDEQELTVRQLSRIESGTSQPSLPKLDYIARRLGVPAYSLMPDFTALPSGYLELKYQVLREPIYGKEEEYDKKEACLEEIYKTYFDKLPKEEQLACEVLQASLDTSRTRRPEYAELILEENMHEITEKEAYSVNDILLIRLFFYQMLIRKDLANFVNQIEKIMSLLAKQKEVTRLENFFIIRDTLIAGMCCLEKVELTDCFNDYLSCLQEIMDRTQDYQKKPLVFMFLWKQALREKRDFSLAESFYQSSKTFAHLIAKDFLVKKLTEEWQEDVKKYL
ncbi:XRE family transcriptional regulator [Streptococcus sp. LQJ-218]|uniref:helix-turn-helix transcriptional regulator n=1 Tax=Streptococcus sp. LQJ-218 TaxID=2283190 RepID=UPI000E3C4465|nr:helix-turn-helix transcriptional regulator [Streptococcus sp. LQJ-218]TAA66685.1 XRE family transcriptional regulator [Streptococcus sp. LQJ-218]